MRNSDPDKAVEIVKVKGETEEQERRGVGFSLSSIGVSYGGVSALKEISFEVSPGEKIGIIGNNGAGKSTLCDVITGLTRPSSGKFIFNEIEATKKSALWRAKKGMRRVFQHPVIFEDLSIEENVIVGSPQFKGDGVVASLFAPRLFYKERKQTALRIMEYCNIEESNVKNLKELPYATKKRIELARALMGNPRVLILDEPAASMNEEERAQYCQVVNDYADTFSTTVIVVEHDLEVIKTICNRAIALDAGELIADGEVVPVLRNEKVMELYLGSKGVA